MAAYIAVVSIASDSGDSPKRNLTPYGYRNEIIDVL